MADDYGDGSIWSLAASGNIEGVQECLQRGVGPDLQNKSGASAVHAAAKGGHVSHEPPRQNAATLLATPLASTTARPATIIRSAS